MENVIEKYTDKDQNRRKKMLFIYNPNAGTGVLKPNPVSYTHLRAHET